MKNIIIDIKNSTKEEVNLSHQNDNLGELLLPGTSLTFPKKLNEEIEVLRSSSQLLDFIPIHSGDALWKIEIIYRSKDSPLTRHAKLSCLHEDDYALQLSGRMFVFSNIEDAFAQLLLGEVLVDNGNTNNPPSPPRY